MESKSPSLNPNQFEEEVSYDTFWYLQHAFIYFWASILIYGSALCLLSLINNTVSSSNLQYAFSILISFLVVVFYLFYFFFKVKNEVNIYLFQLNDLFRIVGLLLLALNYNFGIIVINFAEVFFFAADCVYYRA